MTPELAFSPTALVALTLTAAFLMIFAATSKKVLGWKPAERRCRACGRSDRRDCPCRR